MSRILVTGGTGFVGNCVARLAVRQGHEVAILTRGLNYDSPVPAGTTRFVATLGDVNGQSDVSAWNPEVVIHAAWCTDSATYLRSAENVTLLCESLGFLQAMIATGCSRFVMLGTCAEYDPSAACLTENSPTHPLTLYAASKLALCNVAQEIGALAQVNVLWARLFFPYGPGDTSGRVIPQLMRTLSRAQTFAAGSGEQLRDYIHIEDVAAGLLTLAEHGTAGVWNIASGAPVTIRTLLEEAQSAFGVHDMVSFGERQSRSWDPPIIYGDPSKLRALGWEPQYDLPSGLADTAAWWRAREASGSSA